LKFPEFLYIVVQISAGHWAQRVKASETRKAELHDLLH